MSISNNINYLANDRKPEIDQEVNTQARSHFIVYENWANPQAVGADDLTKYIDNRSNGNYVIWIKEPEAEIYCCRRILKGKRRPDRRLIRLIKTVLRNGHEECISLVRLYGSLWPDLRAVSNLVARNKSKEIRKAIWECGLSFDKCLKCLWEYDDPYPRLILQKTFTYCFIEPMPNSIDG